MSYRAIAGAMALEDVSLGERLVAFSLASFANRANDAWPGVRVAALRAGLGRSQYLAACARLEGRGLIDRDRNGGGNGRSSMVHLRFVDTGDSAGREINPALFEQILSTSPSRGVSRAVLAVLAALADDEGCVRGVTAQELCDAAGVSDSSYRRARRELLNSEAVTLDEAGGGRGRSNRWVVRAPGSMDAAQPRARQERPVNSGMRQLPLIAVARLPQEVRSGTDGEAANPATNPGQIRTVTGVKTPSETPPQTPSAHARVGGEPSNQRTIPPDPPEGGQSPVQIIEQFTSARGRRRQRTITADLNELRPVGEEDRESWLRFRAGLREHAGAQTFDVWLADLAPIAVSAADQALLVAGRRDTHQWIATRFQSVICAVSPTAGRAVRMADRREMAVYDARRDHFSAPDDPAWAGAHQYVNDSQEAV